MKVEIPLSLFDDLVRVWLVDTLEMLGQEQSSRYVHPDDAKSNKKTIKALKCLVDYIGVA